MTMYTLLARVVGAVGLTIAAHTGNPLAVFVISEQQAAELSDRGRTRRVNLVIPWEVLAAYEDQIGNGIFDSIAGFFKSAARFGRSAVRSVASKVGSVLPARPAPPPRPTWTTWNPNDLSQFTPPQEPPELVRSRQQIARAVKDAADARSKFGVPPAWSTTQRFGQNNSGSSAADRDF